MLKDSAISLKNISKIYRLYDKPIDRLKESLHPRGKKYHKEFYALKNINLEVKKGEVLGIVGVNGAGKSTLLKIISGVITPTSGRVNIHGRINAILELGSSLKPELTGRENIKLSLQINSIEKNRDKLTQEIVEFADIGEHIDQPIKSYSSGMKARLGFGIATSTDPDILIVDEVLAVGDVLFQRKCYSKIEKLFKDGKTVIFVSHSAQSVIEFCSRAVLLYDRQIIMDDTPKKVTDYYQKLVFSKDKVRDQINGKVEVEKEKPKVDMKKDIEKPKDGMKKDIEVDKDFYLPELKCQPENINDTLFKFYNVEIRNLEGKKVNVLNKAKYNLSFRIESKGNFQGVYVGAQIKTIKGIIVTGCNIKELLKEQIESVNKSDTYKFNIEFDNLLLSGYYTITLFTMDKNEQTAIQNNAYIFKTKEKKFMQPGFITLNQKITYEKEVNE